MTLLLGMSKPEGIYMSADNRVTDARTEKLTDDSSVKFLSVRYPPDKGGQTSLLAYTGLANLPDGTPFGTWMRQTLRGKSEPFDRSMTHLGARLDRDIARLKIPLIINLLVLQGERRYSGGFSNLEMDQKTLVRDSFGYHLQEQDLSLQGERLYSGGPSNLEMDQRKIRVRDSFGYHLQELEGPFVFADGSRASKVIANQHLNFRRAQLGVPQRPLDHMKLLATINRGVAERTKSVSPCCHVQFINSDDRNSPMSHTFLERGETVPFEMPVVRFGIDLSDMTRRFHDHLGAFFRGEVDDLRGAYLDTDAMNKELRRRP